MKKRYIIIAASILTTLILVLGANYLFSLRKVTFKMSDKVESATVYTSKKKTVKRLTSSGNLMLTEGKYYITPEGDKLSTEVIHFTVGNTDTTVDVDPPYSEAYLKELYKKEQAAIATALTVKYPTLINGFTLTNGTLYRHGNWFGGLLEPKVRDYRERRDPYRVVLHKDEGGWRVIRRPEYILTSSRYEEVPVDVLRQINEIAQ